MDAEASRVLTTFNNTSSDFAVEEVNVCNRILTEQCSGPSCRICRESGEKEKLISPCNCSGSLAYIHLTCLEKWLSEAARKSCEVCLFEFKAKQSSQGFRSWIRSPRSQRERRYIYGDLTCFLLLTPLGIVSTCLCFRGAQEYYKLGETWTGFALISLTGFLALMYAIWVAITVRYHYCIFRAWQKNHTQIKVVLGDLCDVEWKNPTIEDVDGEGSSERVAHQRLIDQRQSCFRTNSCNIELAHSNGHGSDSMASRV